MDLSIDTTDIARFAQRYQRAQPVVREELGRAMTRSVLVIEGDAKRLAPVDTGTLRRSLTHQVQEQSGGVVGRVGTNVPYALVVEEGRTPGKMPPEGALLGWMGRHGIPEAAEYVVRRAINRRKKARPYLRPALAKNRAAISREFAQVLPRVMKRIGAR